MELWLRYDLRSPDIGHPTPKLIEAALEQTAWADAQGFDAVQLAEHHGSADGYNPSPLIFGAAVAARTKSVRIHPIIVVPLHDPVRLAEDLIILDNISNGRVDVTIGVGYVPSEFEMFGVRIGERGRLTDVKLKAMRSAFNGEEFIYDGRHVHVTPFPVQPGGPPLYIGGSVLASARRAAQYGDGFYPMVRTPAMDNAYFQACVELGKSPGKIISTSPTRYIHVAHDPEEAWAKAAPYAMYETNSYARAARELGQTTPFKEVANPDELRATGLYKFFTPDECIAYCRDENAAGRIITLVPLVSGMDPDLSWQNLELFGREVLPALRKQPLPTMPSS